MILTLLPNRFSVSTASKFVLQPSWRYLVGSQCTSSSNGCLRSHYSYANAGQFHNGHENQHHRHDWDHRGFTVGIGGPVGSGKTALVLALTKRLATKVPREYI